MLRKSHINARFVVGRRLNIINCFVYNIFHCYAQFFYLPELSLGILIDSSAQTVKKSSKTIPVELDKIQNLAYKSETSSLSNLRLSHNCQTHLTHTKEIFYGNEPFYLYLLQI